MAKENIWENLWRLINRKNLYALIVSITLSYFIINHSLIGMSESSITAYSLLFLISLTPIYLSKERVVTRSSGLFKWEGEGKGTLFSMTASWATGLFIGLTLMMLIVYFQGRPIEQVNSEFMFSQIAQQTLIIAPVETVVFVVIMPQYLVSALGAGRWGLAMTFLISQGAFTLWHWSAYAGDLLDIMVGFISGTAFLALAIQFRPEFSQGVHTGINIAVTGAITIIGIAGIQ